MTRTIPVGVLTLLMLPATAAAQSSVVGSKHDLNPVYTTSGQVCWYCHTPHTANPVAPLWNREVPGSTYSVYESSTMSATVGQPTGSALLCLSCHDGTIAANLTYHDALFGGGETPQFLSGDVNLTTDLSDDHPVSVDYPTSSPRLIQPAPATLLLEEGKVQCRTCHDPHDDSYGRFLVMSNDQSALCLTCHLPESGWASSDHALATATWNSSGTDPWPKSEALTVQENACGNCHYPHSTGSGSWLQVRGGEEAVCLVCHNGNVAGADVASDIAKTYNHPVGSYSGLHDPGESALLDPVNGTVRHVECTDCHQAHTVTSGSPLAGIEGVDVTGSWPVAVSRESELCYRCHGDSSDRPAPSVQRVVVQGNIRLKFQTGNISFHPVEGPRNSPDVPSLLSPWTASSTMTCGHCHASNTAASAGGSGPEGPHGSIYHHILKKSYLMGNNGGYSRADYDLCWQCHDPAVIEGDLSMGKHNRHIGKVGCNVCHDPHGIHPGDPNADTNYNRQLVNFDTTIISANSGDAYPYWVDLDTTPGVFHGSCYMTCHSNRHRPKSY